MRHNAKLHFSFEKVRPLKLAIIFSQLNLKLKFEVNKEK